MVKLIGRLSLVSSLTLLSRFLGLGRDILFFGCFGASLTQQPRGYVYYLKQELFNYNITSYPYGGMHLNDAGSFYIDDVVSNKLDYLLMVL